MKRTIIQIDGGHLRKTAEEFGLDYTNDVIEQFAMTVLGADEELIRVMYYDAPPFRGSKVRPLSSKVEEFRGDDRWLDDLAARNFFAVRRGVLKWRGWRLKNPEAMKSAPTPDDYVPNFQQKGVDLRIGLDMATFSYESSAERIILVTGDTDFIPAMKLARRRGLQVVGVEFAGRKTELSREFRAHVDIVRHYRAEQMRSTNKPTDHTSRR